MSSARTKQSTAREDRLDWVFHALSDRTRRKLIARLARESAMITELAAPFAMSLPAISRHIKVLERAGLIIRTIDGRIHRCTLDAQALQTVEGWLDHYRQFWAGNLESLAQYVESDTDDRK
jgi:DNA-binding transcriptional ArsR family regulator